MGYSLNFYIENLDVFSMNDRVLYLFLTIAGIFISYLVIKPIITLLVSTNSFHLLSYITSGLLVLFIFLIAILVNETLVTKANHLFKFILQSLAIFGVILCIVNLSRYIRDKLKT